jgi:intein/homing endonuclease
MKGKRILIGTIVVLMLALSVAIYAQVNRPYHNGTVWSIGFIRMKPGMESAYLNYVANDWKREQEELKKDRQIISYKVLRTESHGAGDFNLMLMTEYKDLATMEANQPKEDALVQRVIGDDEKQRQGYRERLEIREVLADRLAREIVLEPRR